jgi:HPt (histidine-containing phosphotransfer) domain-containing protein
VSSSRRGLIDEDAMPEGEGTAGPTKSASNRTQLRSCQLNSALDLVHLALQCQGDAELEKDLLGLFRLQSRALYEQLSDPATLSLESKATIAHKLRGSALVVGAGRVAGAAEALERKALAARGGADQPVILQAIAALEAAIAEVVAEIELIRK